MELKNSILDELARLELREIKIVDFLVDSFGVKFLIKINQSTIEFVVNDANQFEILSVVHHENKYVNAEYLSKFNDFVADVVAIVKPVVKEKLKSVGMLEYREEQAKHREEQLAKRALEIQARENVLKFQMDAFEHENQVFEDEQAKKIRNEARKSSFFVKWIGITVVLFVIILLLALIQGGVASG